MTSCSWYHLTKRRTKDNKPKVYGDICLPKTNLRTLATATHKDIELVIYEGSLADSTALSFDNFITACLPGVLSSIYTQAHDVYIQTTPEVPMDFWKDLPHKVMTNIHIVGRTNCTSFINF